MNSRAHIETLRPAPAGLLTVGQLADLLGRTIGQRVEVSAGGRSFRSVPTSDDSRGILSVSGALKDSDLIEIHVELARVGPHARGSFTGIFQKLASLDEKVRLLEPRKCEGGKLSLAAELRTHTSPLDVKREAVLCSAMERLDELARQLQAELPAIDQHAELERLYKPIEKVVSAVHPVAENEFGKGSSRAQWARDLHDLLCAGCSVALSASTPIEQDFALGLLAYAAPLFGTTVGRVILPSVAPKTLLDLMKTVPGLLAVPANQMAVGNHAYDLNREVPALLSMLSCAERGLVFFGALEELREVFRLGQGANHDPLTPVVVRSPEEVELDGLITFGIREVARRRGALSAAASADVAAIVREVLEEHPRRGRLDLLLRLVRGAVGDVLAGRPLECSEVKRRAADLEGRSETLGGRGGTPAHLRRRKAAVQERFLGRLCHPELLAFFRQRLVGQDRALQELAARLREEVLTRPVHQPLVCCLQGTPGTGKSESVRLLAEEWLEVPFVNVDAASMSDSHTASAQLLGSGRGIVGSHEPGRLETAAKCDRGAVVEVSDLDHATPAVRSHLADLFLQSLETGEIQTATGSMVSCAGLLLVFTMNLPGGQDERVRRPLGFASAPTRREISERVVSQLKAEFSSAFLSRVGTPLLFDPLSERSLAEIAARAVKDALATALSRMDRGPAEIVVNPAVGEAVRSSVEISLVSFGVRGLVEKARALAAAAALALDSRGVAAAGRRLEVSGVEDGMLTVVAL